MITKPEMFPLLVEACPSFAPAWEQFLEVWRTADELPLYLAISDFVRHLSDLAVAGQTESFPAVFAVIERFQREGDPPVRLAATVGILEDMQNRSLHPDTPPETFRNYLGSVSEDLWDRLIALWGDTPPPP